MVYFSFSGFRGNQSFFSLTCMCLFSGQVPLAEEKFVSGGGSFEFQPPDGIPVAIHPLVGFVPYKQVSHCETDSRKFQLQIVEISGERLRH